MDQIVFVLGLPGSGKSTAGRYTRELAQKRGWGHNAFATMTSCMSCTSLIGNERKDGSNLPTTMDSMYINLMRLMMR